MGHNGVILFMASFCIEIARKRETGRIVTLGGGHVLRREPKDRAATPRKTPILDQGE